MKNFMLLVLFCSLCHITFGQNQGPQNNGVRNGNGNFNQTQRVPNNGTDSGTTNRMNLNVGNPDVGNITRPCQPYDNNCIRRYFAEHSHCKKVYGAVPEPLYRKRNIYYLPRINVTVSQYDIKLTGLNGRIEEFYINRDTDKLVIAIEFRGLTVASNRTYVRIHRRSKEPIVVKTSANVTLQSLVVTAIIPQINNLRLDKAVTFGFLNDPAPNYMYGPELLNSTDPLVQTTVAAFQMNPRANVGELLLTDAPFFPATFIQYSLCDFGIKLL